MSSGSYNKWPFVFGHAYSSSKLDRGIAYSYLVSTNDEIERKTILKNFQRRKEPCRLARF